MVDYLFIVFIFEPPGLFLPRLSYRLRRRLLVVNSNSYGARLVDDLDWHINKSFSFFYFFTADRRIALRARGL